MSNFNRNLASATLKSSKGLEGLFVDHITKREPLPDRKQFLAFIGSMDSDSNLLINCNILLSAIKLVECDKFKELTNYLASDNDALKVARKLITTLRQAIVISDVNSRVNFINLVADRAIEETEKEKETEKETETEKDKTK